MMLSSSTNNDGATTMITNTTNEDNDADPNEKITPWNDPNLDVRASKNPSQPYRSRQHVNPLAAKFQQPTYLSDDWPTDVYSNPTKPLFLDIGCSRGGFLLDVATHNIQQNANQDYNYLGLEIRPIIAHQAKSRITKRTHLHGVIDFIGCNVNVDLDRILHTYHYHGQQQDGVDDNDNTPTKQLLQMVCIQFPDPHFKARHAKRRVVTSELVTTLAKYMPPNSTVFLQSDIQSVLDEMRKQFRCHENLFVDTVESEDDYVERNILDVPTEREVSVLERGLPVYRSVFKRTH
jgi:tRNA (guanine-N7-)-methyltransferase